MKPSPWAIFSREVLFSFLHNDRNFQSHTLIVFFLINISFQPFKLLQCCLIKFRVLCLQLFSICLHGLFQGCAVFRNLLIIWMYGWFFDIHFFMMGKSFSFMEKYAFYFTGIMDITLHRMFINS